MVPTIEKIEKDPQREAETHIAAEPSMRTFTDSRKESLEEKARRTTWPGDEIRYTREEKRSKPPHVTKIVGDQDRIASGKRREQAHTSRLLGGGTLALGHGDGLCASNLGEQRRKTEGQPSPLPLPYVSLSLCARVCLCVCCLLYTSPSPRD